MSGFRKMFIVLVASIFFTSSSAIPIKQQEAFQLESHTIAGASNTPIKAIPSIADVQNYKLFSRLNTYYNRIVADVVDTTMREIVETAPETYLTLRELQLIGRDYCQTSLRAFMQVLEKQLNQEVKYSLLASVQPLLDYNYQEGQTMLELNTIMSQRLNEMLQTEKLSQAIIQDFYQNKDTDSTENLLSKLIKTIFMDKKLALRLHHEKNEAIALEAWLRSWLMDIQYMLKDEFDSHVDTIIFK